MGRVSLIAFPGYILDTLVIALGLLFNHVSRGCIWSS